MFGHVFEAKESIFLKFWCKMKIILGGNAASSHFLADFNKNGVKMFRRSPYSVIMGVVKLLTCKVQKGCLTMIALVWLFLSKMLKVCCFNAKESH